MNSGAHGRRGGGSRRDCQYHSHHKTDHYIEMRWNRQKSKANQRGISFLLMYEYHFEPAFPILSGQDVGSLSGGAC